MIWFGLVPLEELRARSLPRLQSVYSKLHRRSTPVLHSGSTWLVLCVKVPFVTI